MKRQYELTVLFAPDLAPDVLKKTQDTIASFINQHGSVEKIDQWGKKQLAYTINKKTEALYVYYEFSLEPSQVKALEDLVLHTEGVIRHLIVNALEN